MRELLIAAVWFSLSAGLFLIEPQIRGDYFLYVNRGKWVALALGIMNLLRPVVRTLGLAFLRKVGLIRSPETPEDGEPPVKPVVVHPEFRVTDDRIQSPPGGNSFTS